MKARDGEIEIVDYDPRWPELFDERRIGCARRSIRR